jgi:hypothetical protein
VQHRVDDLVGQPLHRPVAEQRRDHQMREEAERQFLGKLSAAEVASLRAALQAIAF